MSSSMITKRATSILNGVVGDYLEASNNELALTMGFYKNDTLLDPTRIFNDKDDDDLTTTTKKPKKICILIHGLTDDESTWEIVRNETCGESVRETYGSLLQRDFEIYPLYIRYNTGLHISTNGQKLNRLMKTLLASLGCEEVSFLCHSMGGLVTRSALHYGFVEGASWIQKVTRVVFLGTPHQGSHWERLGNAASNFLGSVQRPYMKVAEKTANLRSAGIKDLRYGYILDEDWQDEENGNCVEEDAEDNRSDHESSVRSSFRVDPNNKKKAILVDSVSYYIVTGTVTRNPRNPIALCVGDALVQKESAEGRSDNEDHHLDFPEENFCEFAGVGHGGLARSLAVYKQIKTWFEMPLPHRERPAQALLDANGENCSDDVSDYENAKSRSSTWAKRKGLASLFQDAIGNGVAAVHDVHMALANETFGLLDRVTPTFLLPRRTGKRIKTAHDTTVGSVYGVIRGVSDTVTETAKLVCDSMAEREQAALSSETSA